MPGSGPSSWMVFMKIVEVITCSFNRFFLPRFHLLTQKYLNSDYSVAEARIIYEIYADPGISARDIVSRLQVDKGYLSRLLKKLETRNIILRTSTSEDSRLVSLSLTDEGKALAEALYLEVLCSGPLTMEQNVCLSVPTAN